MTKKALYLELVRIQREISELRDQETSVFGQLDRYSCKSNDPDDKCLQCNCWKRTRELCS